MVTVALVVQRSQILSPALLMTEILLGLMYHGPRNYGSIVHYANWVMQDVSHAQYELLRLLHCWASFGRWLSKLIEKPNKASV